MSDMAAAIRFFYSGNLEEAESILEEILEEDQHNLSALVRYGAVLEGLNKPKEAGAVYRRISELHYREGSYSECLEALDQAIHYLPEADNLPVMKAICLYRLSRFREASPLFREASPSVENLFFFGKTLFALKEYDEGEKVFRSIKAKAATREDHYLGDFWLSKILYAMGKFSEAVPGLEEYIAAYPGETQAHLDLALCLLEAGDWDKAANHFEEYRNLGGKTEIADYYSGIVCYHKGEYEQAIEYLNMAPKREQTNHWQGLAYYELGLYEEAIRCFTQIEKSMNEIFYLKIMGSAHLKQGNYYEAKLLLEKALLEDPEDQELNKMLSITSHYLEESKQWLNIPHNFE
jgi:superkiller protein 3